MIFGNQFENDEKFRKEHKGKWEMNRWGQMECVYPVEEVMNW